ncbi:MAG TPA: membrane protein insertase YidC [Anaerolineae bacterium]|nr:membrane protein insertase YidC [Anaerolineae bacterium]MCB0177537.1 membrane protein insertase YidC [Anaerolineae bacterium]MCB9107790.1 membrane protein insertase YidC [Anaerolineales bacterium]HRV90869.1 membrane protein insertase YidC [Anaerolineae bacterium]
MRTLKLLVFVMSVVGLASLLILSQPATAAPPDAPDKIDPLAQQDGVTIEKLASKDVVALGSVVSYTIKIKNDSGQAIEATLTDELPELPDGLALQTDSITTTIGTVEAQHNAVLWSGNLENGDEATILYSAIPPTTSSPQENLENTAILKYGETTRQATASINTEPPSLGIWGRFVNFIATALVFFDKSLASIGVPYAFGFAIILFTLLVRGATFPLNMQQIKSSKAMQELQPKLKELQEKHKGDKEKLAQEQMRLYKEHGVNPLGGCLPMLVQMPIWIALYRALIQLSSQGLLTEGFFWIPSLSGPVSSWGGGLDWLWPLPPSIGWPSALAYLVMPVLLVVSQLYMQNLMTPPSTDPSQAQVQSIMKFMPLMFGYFALIVPSGLTLYWFTSNVLGVAQHYFTKTQFDTKSKTSEPPVGSSAPVPASASSSTSLPGATSEGDDKGKNVKSKRKSRRKR